jgi:uncharacterized membrane protein YkvA (DUF1232 family)
MATRLKYWLSFPSLVRSAIVNIRLATRLLREPRVPLLLKAVPILGLVYVVSPLDFIPDVIPVIGEVDDLALIVLAIEAFKRFCPTHIVAHHATAIEQGRRYAPIAPGDPGDFIDAEFRRQ